MINPIDVILMHHSAYTYNGQQFMDALARVLLGMGLQEWTNNLIFSINDRLFRS